MGWVMFYAPWGFCAWDQFPAQWVPRMKDAHVFDTLEEAEAAAKDGWPEMPMSFIRNGTWSEM